MVVPRIELDAVGHLAVAEGGRGAARLHVPQADEPVEARGQELLAGVAELHGAHALRVAAEGPSHLEVLARVPDLALAVNTR